MSKKKELVDAIKELAGKKPAGGAAKPGVLVVNNTAPQFKEGRFEQAGVSFALPGLSSLMERLGELSSQQLKVLTETNVLPWHPEMPRKEIEFALGAVLQAQWYRQTAGVVPTKIAQTLSGSTAHYRELIDKLNKGEPIMAKKKTVTKKSAPKEKSQKLVTVYELKDAARARDFLKENEGKDSYSTHILTTLLENGKKMFFPELREAVGKSYKPEGGKGTRAHSDSVYSTCRKLRDHKPSLLSVEREVPPAA